MTSLNVQESPRVLVVEDDAALRGLYQEALETEGYSVSVASDGVEGLNRFDQSIPDLILLDLLMPRMNGWQALEELRMVSACPVIIVTGQGTTEDIIKGLLEAGADDYLVKPFGIRELLARVGAVLRRSVTVKQWC